MKIRTILLALGICCIALLPGCVKAPKYSAQKLSRISERSADYQETNKDVTLRIKKFSTDDCLSVFGDQGHYISRGKRGLYPLQLTITNNNINPWELTPEGIDLKLVPSSYVLNKMQYSPLGRFFGYSALGVVTYCVCLATAIPFVATTAFGVLPLAIPLGFACIGGGLFTMATPFIALHQAIGTGEANNMIATDIKEKALRTLIIEPGNTENKLIFVRKKQYKEQFTITLQQDAPGKECLTFKVDLKDNSEITEEQLANQPATLTSISH